MLHRTEYLLRRCYLLMKTWSILKWNGSTMFLKQLSSSNNRPAKKIPVKVFCPACQLIPFSQSNSKLNSPPTIHKARTIHCNTIKLNDCNKLSYLHSIDITNLRMRYKTLHKPWLGFLVAQLFLNRMSATSSLDLQIIIVWAVCNRLSENRCEM